IIVAAGQYDPSRQTWHKGNKRYLFNAFALAKVWRARMLEAINQHPTLWLP
ncbi:transposase, partial [Vibrio sp. 10N.261.49.A11]